MLGAEPSGVPLGTATRATTEALTGLAPPRSGSIKVAGRELEHAKPRAALRAGIGHVPEDRIKDGLVATFSVAENLVLNTYDDPPFAHGPVMDPAKVRSVAVERAKEFDIRAPSVEVEVRTLSGGNQQKVIIARELSRPIRLLIASQPTHGLDVRTVAFVQDQLLRLRDRGVGVLLVSSDLAELWALSDRIMVAASGRLRGTVAVNETSYAEIGHWMSGG